MTDPRFLKCVPASLRNEHKQLTAKRDDYQKKAKNESRQAVKDLLEGLSEYQKNKMKLLELLTTRDEMEVVWKAIIKRKPGRELDFVQACEHAQWYWQANTKGEIRNKTEAVAELARTLARANRSLNDVFNHDMLYALLPNEDLPVIGITQEILGADFTDGTPLEYSADYAFFDSQERLPATATPPNCSILLPVGASVSNLLERLADYVELCAERFNKDTLTITKPRASNADQTYFIKSMTQYLRDTYGTPLRDVVATTAGVIFSNEVTSEHVRAVAP